MTFTVTDIQAFLIAMETFKQLHYLLICKWFKLCYTFIIKRYRYTDLMSYFQHTICIFIVVVVQLLSRVQLCATPRTAACQAPLSSTISQNLLKFMSNGSVLSKHLILCLPVLFFSFNLSQHQDLFQWVSSLHQEAKILDLPSASVFIMNIQGWFPLELISLQSKGLSRVFFRTTIQKHQFFGA